MIPRSDICPGGNSSINCLIASNSENLHLIWRVTFPGNKQRIITHDRNSLTNASFSDMNISSTVIRYTNNGIIESRLMLTGLTTEIEVECAIADPANLDLANAVLPLNILRGKDFAVEM